jgi:excisionase family DNA binding protein
VGLGAEKRLAVDERPWFTPETLAARLQVSERMIRKWVTQGRLRSYKIDGCRRFNPADVDVFLLRFLDGRDGSDE